MRTRLLVKMKENEWENFTTAAVAVARGKNKIVQRLTFGLMYIYDDKEEKCFAAGGKILTLGL